MSRRSLETILALLLAAGLWLPCVHFLFQRDLGRYRSTAGIPAVAQGLAASHLAVWSDAELRHRELDRMRERNPEWDFMSRTFFALALANMALREPARRAQACEILDAILRNTLEVEREKGFRHFLMRYGQTGRWVVQPPGSLFVDGEIALMLAARRSVEEEPSYKPLLAARVDAMISRMRQSPVLCGESYPNECWLFCNTVALAAIRMADVLDGTDHAAFLSDWIETAQGRLANPETGLLISTCRVDGQPIEYGYGPEGSTIWMAAHMLQIVDPVFAASQYRRARRELARTFLGFGYSREWPAAAPGTMDVDSGPVIPGLGASASASGLAILGAAAFHDDAYLRRLFTSLELGGFPYKRRGRLRYMASNPVGDAVLLYAMTEGPLWDRIRQRMRP